MQTTDCIEAWAYVLVTYCDEAVTQKQMCLVLLNTQAKQWWNPTVMTRCHQLPTHSTEQEIWPQHKRQFDSKEFPSSWKNSSQSSPKMNPTNEILILYSALDRAAQDWEHRLIEIASWAKQGDQSGARRGTCNNLLNVSGQSVWLWQVKRIFHHSN